MVYKRGGRGSFVVEMFYENLIQTSKIRQSLPLSCDPWHMPSSVRNQHCPRAPWLREGGTWRSTTYRHSRTFPRWPEMNHSTSIPIRMKGEGEGVRHWSHCRMNNDGTSACCENASSATLKSCHWLHHDMKCFCTLKRRNVLRWNNLVTVFSTLCLTTVPHSLNKNSKFWPMGQSWQTMGAYGTDRGDKSTDHRDQMDLVPKGLQALGTTRSLHPKNK